MKAINAHCFVRMYLSSFKGNEFGSVMDRFRWMEPPTQEIP